MGKVRHIDWYADEWIAGTLELGNAERGLFITTCCLIYSTGGPITRDRLRAACRMEHGLAFNRQLDALIKAGKLQVNGEQITNKRCVNELQKAENRSAKARQNGGEGGRPRKENNDVGKPDGFHDEKLTTNLPTTNHQPEKPSSEGSKRAQTREVAEAMLAVWRTECGDVLGSPTKASDSRITKCSARLRDLGGDIEEWRELCRRIRRSRYLTEKWKATIDWVLEPANMLKIQEGNYDDDRSGSLANRRRSRHDAELEAFEFVSRA